MVTGRWTYKARIPETRQFPCQCEVTDGNEMLTYVPDRTCRPIRIKDQWTCDQCGCHIVGTFYVLNGSNREVRFCPNCRARVVK